MYLILKLSNVGNGGSIPPRGVILRIYCALGWTKTKIFAFENVASQINIWCMGAAETRL